MADGFFIAKYAFSLFSEYLLWYFDIENQYKISSVYFKKIFFIFQKKKKQQILTFFFFFFKFKDVFEGGPNSGQLNFADIAQQSRMSEVSL